MKELNWVEKYRPKAFEDYISDDLTKIDNMLKKPFEMPHLLLVSKVAGTGKTTLGRLIISKLNADSLLMNSSNERRIEDIREKILKFAKMAPLNRNAPKVVMLDEFDGVTNLSQQALRNIMETYSRYCKFIITANNINKIHHAIKSRCVLLDFKFPPKNLVKKRLKFIIENEKLPTNNMDGVVEKLITLHYPSIRDMINHVQMASFENKELTPELFKSSYDIELEIYKALKERLFIKARRMWIERGLDCSEILNSFVDFVLKDNDLELELKKQVMILIAETNFRTAFGADNEIQFCGFAIQFIDLLKGEEK